MEMIKTQDLAFTYPGTEDHVNTRALRGVDVTIERGSFVVILGHNGSGKSTLAKTFNAVLLPSSLVLHCFLLTQSWAFTLSL